ncbi:MAG: beta-N-acetylhexosaminidase [Saprospiraceae bacterium]
MKKQNLYLVLFILILGSCSTPIENIEDGIVSIIPKPNNQIVSEGFFLLNKKSTIVVESETQSKIANHFLSSFNVAQELKPSVQGGEDDGNIIFETKESIPSEGYILDVKKEVINIQASSDAGFFYALQSLKQMMPVSFFSKKQQSTTTWRIPLVRIEDAPAFGWRGYMLDVSRHFFGVEKVKEVLDFMAENKLNRFHWHLADDQGWRVEIKAYPKLTEIGAWRMDYKNTDETKSDWWGRPVQKEGEKATYGGFYTQEEIKEIIAYAKERYIEVIPEIDMPGHAQATIAAYPEIGCVNASQFVATGGVFQNNTYNPGKEETYKFAETMLNEIMDLFPFKYIHIGGDECNKNQWKMDPDAQRKMKAEGLKNEEELQSYFIKRIEKMINARDRIMIGWDEILEGGLAPNAVVMSWRGEKGGIIAAKAGHEVIMTPNKFCYVDLKQGHDDFEPNLGYSRSLLSDAYNYQVIPDSLLAEEKKLIKGIQANMWTESISDWGKLTYMTFPRLYAIAENGWTKQENKNWDDFTERLSVQMKRLDAQEVRYAVSAFSPWIDHQGNGENIEVNIKTEVNHLNIHYTLDGSEPNLSSKIYKKPFTTDKSVQLRARAFKDSVAVGYLSALDFPIHLAANKKVKDQKGKPHPKMTDLSYGRLTSADKAWHRFRNEVELTLSFDESTSVKEVNFNSLRYTILGIYPPKKVEVWGSTDGKEFKLLGEIEQLEKSLEQGRNKVKSAISFSPTAVKKIKIKAFAHRPLGEGHHRVGENSVIAIDEIIVF